MIRPSAGELPRRPLGRTGEELSIIGLGGIVVMDETQEQANLVVRDAIEAGVNYFDVAPSYSNAEERLGPALEPFRKDVFLACKSFERTAAAVDKELEQSLRHLRTDHLDLYQMHSLETRQDVETAFGPGGAAEAFTAARQAGKVRFLGFSAHSVEAALAAMEAFEFDTVLLPLNYVNWYAGNFGPLVVERAQEAGMGILALKGGAHTLVPDGSAPPYAKCWYQPHEDLEEIRLSYSWTLSLPVTAALPPGEEKFWRLALEAVRSLKTLTEDDYKSLEAKARSARPLFRYPAWE